MSMVCDGLGSCLEVLGFNCCDECVGMQLLWVRKLRQAAPGVTAATVVVFYQTGIVLASA